MAKTQVERNKRYRRRKEEKYKRLEAENPALAAKVEELEVRNGELQRQLDEMRAKEEAAAKLRILSLTPEQCLAFQKWSQGRVAKGLDNSSGAFVRECLDAIAKRLKQAPASVAPPVEKRPAHGDLSSETIVEFEATLAATPGFEY